MPALHDSHEQTGVFVYKIKTSENKQHDFFIGSTQRQRKKSELKQLNRVFLFRDVKKAENPPFSDFYF